MREGVYPANLWWHLRAASNDQPSRMPSQVAACMLETIFSKDVELILTKRNQLNKLVLFVYLQQEALSLDLSKFWNNHHVLIVIFLYLIKK